MIKLTLYSNRAETWDLDRAKAPGLNDRKSAPPLVKTFDQKVTTIGSGNGPTPADLSLPGPELQPIHVKIMEEGNRFLAINFANDPFVSLNGLPFGKKELKNKDLLQIGNHVILFEIEDRSQLKKRSIPVEPQADPLKTAIEKLIDPPIQHLPSHVPVFPFGQVNEETQLKAVSSSEQSKLKKEQLEAWNLDDLIREVEQFEQVIPKDAVEQDLSEKEEIQPTSFHQYFTPLPIEEREPQAVDSIPKTMRNHLEYQVGEFDDESETWTIEKDDKGPHEAKPEVAMRHINWKMLGTLAVSLLFIFFLIAGTLYFNISAKNEDEELRAAESLADIAMALKYAQIHHIKPLKKNWSDPEFINKSLAQVIPHDYSSLVHIDPQGHINNTSYSLRIYTSTDFSQFLVIAQPAPRVLQWLIPKTAIVIDSKLMQLRKVADIKTLNRLLVNSNNLDNSNAIEVTNLVKRGELISLNILAQKRKGQDFSPPRALALMRPGAQDYIYNAPRYYQLGETIMKRAIDLMEKPGSVYEMSRLKQDMSLLSKMHDMVLYSSSGIQLTLDAQKAIAAFVSNARFLTAYLKFDSNGVIINSHLIIDDESSHYQPVEEKYEVQSIQSQKPEKTIAEEQIKNSDLQLQVPIEKHPLLAQLVQLCTSRKMMLTPLKTQITAFLNEDIDKPINSFELQLADMIDAYFDADLKQKQEMARGIQHLAEEYQLMPLEEFMAYLDQAGLDTSCRDILKHVVEMKDQDQQLQNYVQNVKIAENFTELLQILNNANRWLIVKNFSDLNQLHMAQKFIKIEAIARINKLLLSFLPTPALHYNDEQRLALQEVLQLLLANAEEQAYYLDEFDRMLEKE